LIIFAGNVFNINFLDRIIYLNYYLFGMLTSIYHFTYSGILNEASDCYIPTFSEC